MFKANYHTHSKYCDGLGEPAEYAEAAVKDGFKALGFSSHAPCPGLDPAQSEWMMKSENAAEYIRSINDLKAVYSGRLQIYTSMECDYLGQDTPNYRTLYGLDYVLGGVHMIRDESDGTIYNVDNSREDFEQGVRELAGGDIKRYIEIFYQRSMDMLPALKPDIAAHIDLVRRFNTGYKYFTGSEPWYLESAFAYIERLAAYGVIVEINTSKWTAGILEEPYPQRLLLDECLRKGVKVTISSDCHDPELLTRGYADTVEYLKNVGYRELYVLDGGVWRGELLK